MAVFFILITLVVQLGFLVIARSAVSASLEGVARRSATPGGDVRTQQDRLRMEIEAIAPGLDVVSSRVTRDADVVRASVTVVWVPPGPQLLPVQFTLVRTRAVVVPP